MNGLRSDNNALQSKLEHSRQKLEDGEREATTYAQQITDRNAQITRLKEQMSELEVDYAKLRDAKMAVKGELSEYHRLLDEAGISRITSNLKNEKEVMCKSVEISEVSNVTFWQTNEAVEYYIYLF